MEKNHFSKKYVTVVMLFYLFFAIRILFTSLVSVFLLDQGNSAQQVSSVSAVALVASFFTVPWIGKITDKFGPKRVSCVLLVAASIAGLLFAFSKSLFLTGMLYSIVMICINTLHPIVEKQATQTDFSYGSVRIWGTIGNAIGTQLGGLIYEYGSPQFVYVIFSLAAITTSLVMNTSIPDIAAKTDASARTEKRNKGTYSIGFVLYLVVVFCFYAALDTKNLYLTAFLRTSVFSINEASTILFIASLLEIPVVLFGGRMVDKFGSKAQVTSLLMLLGFQLVVYAFLNSFALIVCTTLITNSVVSMFFIMINMKVINEMIDAKHQLSALSITAGIRSFAAVVGQIIGGKLIDAYSYQSLFAALFAFVAAAMVITLVIKFPHRKADMHLYS